MLDKSGPSLMLFLKEIDIEINIKIYSVSG